MNIEFVLELLKNKIEQVYPLPTEYAVSKGNQNGFEIMICDKLTELVEAYPEISYYAHMGHHFPDVDIIIANKIYGIELKSRNNGAWTTNGNSVFESISNDNYEEIFILFGTQKNQRFEVKYKYYWQATEDIAVTHSPRFKVNMNGTNSVFDSKAQYDDFRMKSDEEKSVFLQTYLSEKSQGVKWFSAKIEERVEPLLLKQISESKKKQILAEMFVLFPQDLLHPTKKNDYTNAAKYLISTYYTYSPSLRDEFTSGGKVNFPGLNAPIPRKYETFVNHRDEIENFCNNATVEQAEFIYSVWEKNITGLNIIKQNLHQDYLLILDSIGMYCATTLKNDGTELMLSELISTYEV